MGSLRVSKKRMLCGCRKETEMSRAKIKFMIHMVENPEQTQGKRQRWGPSFQGLQKQRCDCTKDKEIKVSPKELELHRNLKID